MKSVCCKQLSPFFPLETEKSLRNAYFIGISEAGSIPVSCFLKQFNKEENLPEFAQKCLFYRRFCFFTSWHIRANPGKKIPLIFPFFPLIFPLSL